MYTPEEIEMKWISTKNQLPPLYCKDLILAVVNIPIIMDHSDNTTNKNIASCGIIVNCYWLGEMYYFIGNKYEIDLKHDLIYKIDGNCNPNNKDIHLHFDYLSYIQEKTYEFGIEDVTHWCRLVKLEDFDSKD
jgi:hypothetical protein